MTFPDGSTEVTTAGPDGKWSVPNPGLQDGDEVQATAKDPAGNVSDPGYATVDGVAPDAPIIDQPNTSDPVTGSAEPNSEVTVTFPDGSTEVTTAGPDGKWSVPNPGLQDGDEVKATAKDPAGNVSDPGYATVDGVAPDAPIIDQPNTSDPITGSAEPGSEVTVTFPDGSTEVTTAGPDGKWSVPNPGLQDGDEVKGTAKDPAGNVSDPGYATVDGVAPDAPIIDQPNRSDQITGSAEPNSEVTVTFPDGSTEVTTAGPDGKWSVPNPGLKDGDEVKATAKDPAGNVSDPGYATVDGVAPDAPIIDPLDPTNPVTGSAEPNSEVTVTFPDGSTEVTTAGPDGKWSVPNPGLVDADEVQATAKDPAGNVSDPGYATLEISSPTQTVSIDSYSDDVAPLTGEFSSGSSTNDNSPSLNLTVSDSLATGEEVVVYRDGVKLGKATLVNGNTYVFNDSNLADGQSYSYTTRIENAYGKQGPESSPFTLTVDTSAAGQLILDTVVDNVEELVGNLNSGDSTNDNIPTFNGHGAEPNALITLKDANGNVLGTATADTDGNWSVEPNTPLTDGPHNLQVTQTDPAGNESAPVTFDLNVDTTAPSTTDNVINITSISDDTGTSTSDFITKDTSLTINGTLTGTLAAGEVAQISIDDGATWIDLVVSGGSWSYVDGRTLLDGTYTYQVRVVDAAGNVGSTASQEVVVDTTPPAATTLINITSISDDTGTSTSDFITKDTSLTINGTLTGTLAAGEVAQISIDGGATWIDLVVSGGKWNYIDGRTLLDGTYTYQVRVVDAAGNVGSTASQEVVVDTTPPAATTLIDIVSISDDSGTSTSDFLTNDTSLTINGTLTGTLAAGEVAQISIDGGATWIDLVVSGGNWNYIDGRTLLDGTYTYQVRVVDAAGNVGSEDSQEVVVDTTPPAATTLIDIVSISDDTGTSTSDFITKDTSLTINGTLTGTLAAGEVAQISIDGGATWIDLVVSGGKWNYIDGRTLLDGTYTYQVRVVDAAGNVGSKDSQEVVVDTTPPAATTLIDIVSISDDTGASNSDFITRDTNLTINGTLTGTLAAGEVAQISIDGGATWIDLVVSGGTWNYIDGRTLASATYTYQVRVVDAADNVGSTDSQEVVVDNNKVNILTVISNVIDDVDPTQGDISVGGYTNDTSPIIKGIITTGTLAASDRVIVLRDGIILGEATIVGNTWTYQDNGLLDGKQYTYTAYVENIAGNKGNTSSFYDINVDTTAPSVIITSSDLILSANETVTITFSFSEIVSNFDLNDIVVTGGILGGNLIQVDDKTWTVTFTQSGTAPPSIQVGDGSFIDRADNEGIGSILDENNGGFIVDQPEMKIVKFDYFVDDFAPITQEFGSGSTTNDLSPSFHLSVTGTVLAGDTLEIYRNGEYAGNALYRGDNKYFFTDNNGLLVDGVTYEYTAHIKNSGISGPESEPFIITIDTTAPTQIVHIDTATDNYGSVQGPLLSGASTDDSTPILNGTVSSGLAANEVIAIYRDNVKVGTATIAAGSTQWTYSDDSGLPIGLHTYTAQVEDAAGNQGNLSNTFSLNIIDQFTPTGTISVNSIETADTTPVIRGSYTDDLAADQYIQVTVNGITYKQGDGNLTVNTATKTWSLSIPDANALNVDGSVDLTLDVNAEILNDTGSQSISDTTTNELIVYQDVTIDTGPTPDAMSQKPILTGTAKLGLGEHLVVKIYDSVGTLVQTFSSALGAKAVGGLELDPSNNTWKLNLSNWGSSLAVGSYTVQSSALPADGSTGGQTSTKDPITVVGPKEVVVPNVLLNDINSKVLALDNGEYLLFWAQKQTNNRFDIVMQHYDQQGNAVGELVNLTGTTGRNEGYKDATGSGDYNVASSNLSKQQYDVILGENGTFNLYYSTDGHGMKLAQVEIANYDYSGTRNSVKVFEVTHTENAAYTIGNLESAQTNNGIVNIFYFNDGIYAVNSDQASGTAPEQLLTSTPEYRQGSNINLGIKPPVGGENQVLYSSRVDGLSAVGMGGSKYLLHYQQHKINPIDGLHTINNQNLKVYDYVKDQNGQFSSVLLDSMKINTHTTGYQFGALSLALKEGSFVSLWVSNFDTATASIPQGTMDGFNIYSRRFKFDNATNKIEALQTTEQQVNTSTDGVNGAGFKTMNTGNHHGAALEQGGYVVVWVKMTSVTKSAMYSQLYDAVGNKVGTEQLIISSPDGTVDLIPEVVALKDGGYAVTWTQYQTTDYIRNPTNSDIKVSVFNADGSLRAGAEGTLRAESDALSPTAEYLSGAGVLIASDGVTTLDGRDGATDLIGGNGNDSLIIQDSNFNSITGGGGGTDTLIWDSTEDLTLGDILSKVNDIEVIHLGDQYANTLYS
ncbi:Ig-like protein group 3 [Acinetobacter calcoaceticus]|uniref:Ig-like protein group 3 n=1 Tax=Acinetobacter calcoaceticus TaxID=471 RepID=A0A4R1X890_ACICA|nr:Ig-like protein group 3 [Acinetobacter calcoaceticus]